MLLPLLHRTLPVGATTTNSSPLVKDFKFLLTFKEPEHPCGQNFKDSSSKTYRRQNPTPHPLNTHTHKSSPSTWTPASFPWKDASLKNINNDSPVSLVGLHKPSRDRGWGRRGHPSPVIQGRLYISGPISKHKGTPIKYSWVVAQMH